MARSKALQSVDEEMKLKQQATEQVEQAATEEKSSSTDGELDSIKAFMKSMQEQLNKTLEENKKLQEQILELSKQKDEDVANSVDTSYDRYSSVENNNMIKIIHLQEVAPGLTTHIVLSDTTRDLRRLGDVININRSQAEELVGKYLSFFENGVLAIDTSCMAFAEEYSLPIYDKQTKAVYNSKQLERAGDMSNKELQNFFESLSFSAQNQFLSFWLTKCYVKDPKFYNREKLAFLDKISDSDVFSAIIFEINNNESRVRNQ